jgi:hypothetical protein
MSDFNFVGGDVGFSVSDNTYQKFSLCENNPFKVAAGSVFALHVLSLLVSGVQTAVQTHYLSSRKYDTICVIVLRA